MLNYLKKFSLVLGATIMLGGALTDAYGSSDPSEDVLKEHHKAGQEKLTQSEHDFLGRVACLREKYSNIKKILEEEIRLNLPSNRPSFNVAIPFLLEPYQHILEGIKPHEEVIKLLDNPHFALDPSRLPSNTLECNTILTYINTQLFIGLSQIKVNIKFEVISDLCDRLIHTLTIAQTQALASNMQIQHKYRERALATQPENLVLGGYHNQADSPAYQTFKEKSIAQDAVEEHQTSLFASNNSFVGHTQMMINNLNYIKGLGSLLKNLITEGVSYRTNLFLKQHNSR